MKKIIFIMLLCTVPMLTFAQTEDDMNYTETTKYFKTIYVNRANLVTTQSLLEPSSYSIEVSKEEYDNYTPDTSIQVLDTQKGLIETNYKKMTTTIKKINSTTFRYTVNLDWKTMPSTRSYDIIGIGFASSVKAKSNSFFEQNYCLSSGECKKTSTHNAYLGANGVGASFALPSGSIKSLSQTLYVDIVKTNTSNTIYKLIAYGDYSHAQKTISKENANNYRVDTSGIILSSSIDSYYDHINTADATWTGTW